MRHLRVPKQKTQSILDCLNSFEWSSKGYRVLDDGEFKLIPLGDNPPESLPDPLNQFEEKEAEQLERLPQKWIGYLPQFIDELVDCTWQQPETISLWCSIYASRGLARRRLTVTA